MSRTLPRVIAAVVACNRPHEVERLLARLQAQSLPLTGIVVVDNGQDAETPAICHAAGARHLRSAINLGGAGGFALAMLLALAEGAEFVWLWDDDGWPEQTTALAQLVQAQEELDTAITSPLVLDDANQSRSAFIFRINGKVITERAVLQEMRLIEGTVHLFNGALIPAAIVRQFGLPDLRLFIRGDEIDLMWRIRRGGGRVVTVPSVTARHPAGLQEVRSVLRGRLSVVDPPDDLRRFMLFRNRTNIFFRHLRWHIIAADALRYGIYFLARRRPDWKGWQEWCRASWHGLRGNLGPPTRQETGR